MAIAGAGGCTVSKAINGEFSFRKAVRADALCIGVLGMQVFLDTYATEGIRPSLAREVLQSLAPQVVGEIVGKAGHTFIVAEANGHLVGFAHLTERADHELVPSPEASELNRLYVQERFIRRGLGRALLAQAEAAALASGASVLWLAAWVANARALAFYSRQGYEQLGSTLFEFQGEQYENRVFAKTLGAETGR
jgi:GNAT superfamily N-acetyltransferase